VSRTPGRSGVAAPVALAVGAAGAGLIVVAATRRRVASNRPGTHCGTVLGTV
jgi:hypothetical protein